MQWRGWRHAFRLVAVLSVLLAGQVKVQAQTERYVTPEQAARASLSSLQRSSSAAAAATAGGGNAAVQQEIAPEALELLYGRRAARDELQGFAPATANAAAAGDLPERVHVFLFGHARDRTIGRGVIGGRGLVLSLFNTAFVPVPEIEVLVYEVGFAPNSLFSQNNMLNTIRSANIGPRDVVFCYVMAHGGSTTSGLITRQRTERDGRTRTVPDVTSPVNHQRRYGHFWGMESPSRQVMPRTVLAAALINTPARLKILISDSCNNPTTNPLAIPPAPSEAAFAATPSDQFFHLLTAFEGLVDINSSETGQYSWYSSAQPPTPASGIFTRIFCNAAAASTQLDWAQFFTNVQAETNRQAKTVRGTDPRDGRVKVGWRQFPMLMLPIDRVRPLAGAQPAQAPVPDGTVDGTFDEPVTNADPAQPAPGAARSPKGRSFSQPKGESRPTEPPLPDPAESTREATSQDAGPPSVPADQTNGT